MLREFLFPSWKRVCMSKAKDKGWEQIYSLIEKELQPSHLHALMGVEAIHETILLYKEEFLPFVESCTLKLNSLMNTTDKQLFKEVVRAKSALLTKIHPNPAAIGKCVFNYIQATLEMRTDKEKLDMVKTLMEGAQSLLETNKIDLEEKEILAMLQIVVNFRSFLNKRRKAVEKMLEGYILKGELDPQEVEQKRERKTKVLREIKLCLPTIIASLLLKLHSKYLDKTISVHFSLLDDPATSPDDLQLVFLSSRKS